jgi:hypothetical protein
MMKPVSLSIAFLALGVSLAADGAQWWKGNLHTHSFWSDGNDFPEMIASAYKDRGYHFLAFTEHNILSRGRKWVRIGADDPVRLIALGKYWHRFGREWVETRGDLDEGTLEVRLKPFQETAALLNEPGRFLLLEGEEITDGAEDGNPIHMNVINQPDYIDPPGGDTVREVIADSLAAATEQEGANGQPVLFFVNHLNYHWGVKAADLTHDRSLRFIEVWNGVETDNDPGDEDHPSTDIIWDAANHNRITRKGWPPVMGVAGDDAHDYHGFSQRARPFRAWVMVRADQLTPESILRAMREGDFYSTTGVTLEELAFDGQTLRVGIAADAGVTYTVRFIGGRKGDGEPIIFREVKGTVASYELTGKELYVRAQITSDALTEVPSSEFSYQRAWTQPVGWRD